MVLPDFDLETVTLTPDKITMSSDTELTQYFIKEWNLKFVEPGFISVQHIFEALNIVFR